MSSRTRRARRSDADGSALRWPGATPRFALFAEVLFVGLVVTALSLPLVTLPVAFVVGARHLERYLLAEDTTLRRAALDLRAALPGGLLLGLASVAVALLLALDIVIALESTIPGAPLVLGVGVVLAVAAGVLLLALAVRWRPETGWSVRRAVAWLRSDPVAVAYLASALGLLAVLTWQLAPLAPLAIGCLVFAGVALSLRRG